ncbi:MAG TPA: FHA domain-containing protein [Thermoflexales bacterium]|nr:FHA domain-containing protein [Thermoflexales bacterium]
MPYVLRGSLGEEYRIETQARIGRDPSNQIVLPDLLVSRMHATVMVEQGSLQLVDNGSANGTRVNGVPVKTSTLKPGDTVQFGNTPLTVDFVSDAAQTVVRGPDAYAAAPPASYGSQAPAYIAQPQSPSAQTYPLPAYSSSAAPAYGQPAGPYPQAAPSGFGVPGTSSPPAGKKGRLGRFLLLGCLLPIVLCVLLSLGGYVALRAGLINLNTFGLGPGDISVTNRRGDAIRVAILELAPPSGTAPIRGALALNGSDTRTYRVDVPGRYQVDFRREAGGTALGTCLLTVKSGGRYQFEAGTDTITITLVDPAAAAGAGQNIATAALCR